MNLSPKLNVYNGLVTTLSQHVMIFKLVQQEPMRNPRALHAIHSVYIAWNWGLGSRVRVAPASTQFSECYSVQSGPDRVLCSLEDPPTQREPRIVLEIDTPWIQRPNQISAKTRRIDVRTISISPHQKSMALDNCRSVWPMLSRSFYHNNNLRKQWFGMSWIERDVA